MTSYEEYEPEEPRGWSPLAVALIATLVLLLGLGGALFGIDVADRNKKAAAGTLPESVTTGTPTPTPTVASPGPSPSPTATPPAPPTATATVPPTTAPFPLPPLTGLDFQAARTKVRDLKLGWSISFDSIDGGDLDSTVRGTDPVAGTLVNRGDSVTIFVRGSAPFAAVPPVTGLSCDQAAAQIVDKGLYPTYPTGKTGTVQTQSPPAADPSSLHWNDHVAISCS